MFDFYNEVIINSALDEQSGLAKFAYEASTKTIKVLRVGNFEVPNITVDGGERAIIYKVTPRLPQKAQAEIQIPSGLAVGQKLRLFIDLKLSNAAYSEFASQGRVFNIKPYWIEIDTPAKSGGTVETPANIAEYIVKAMNANFARFNNAKFRASIKDGNTDTIVIDVLNEYMRFNSVQLQTIDTLLSSEKERYFTPFKYGKVTREGQEGFGTYEYMMKNIQLPTTEHTNWMALGQDSKIIPGVNYTMYKFTYVVKRQHAGIQTIGEEMYSASTHVFWVAQDAVDEFETVLTGANVLVQDGTKKNILITVNPQAVQVKVDATVTLDVKVSDGSSANVTSKDPLTASVSGKVVTGKKAGSTTLEVTAKGVTVEVPVTVQPKG